MSDDKNIEAVLAPQDVAELSAAGEAILAHPMRSPEELQRLNELRLGSKERIEAKMAEPGEHIGFDLGTEQGHIDAVTYVQSALLGMAFALQEATDQVAMHDLFSEMYDCWMSVPENVRFNVLLNTLGGCVGLIREAEKAEKAE